MGRRKKEIVKKKKIYKDPSCGKDFTVEAIREQWKNQYETVTELCEMVIFIFNKYGRRFSGSDYILLKDAHMLAKQLLI